MNRDDCRDDTLWVVLAFIIAFAAIIFLYESSEVDRKKCEKAGGTHIRAAQGGYLCAQVKKIDISDDNGKITTPVR